jgi:hypothetical protein
MIRRSLALSAVVVVLASAAHAESGEAMALAIGTCSAQTDAQARLTCYDQLAAKLKAGEAIGPQASVPATSVSAPAYTSAPVAQAPAAPAQTPAQSFGQAAPEGPKQTSSWYDVGGWFGGSDTPRAATGTPAEFGAESVPAPKEAPGGPPVSEPLDQITANVTSVAFSGTGLFTVTLDNGQLWRQVKGGSGTARFSRDGHESVTISRGFIGSYNLVVAGQNMTFKVRRVQ